MHLLTSRNLRILFVFFLLACQAADVIGAGQSLLSARLGVHPDKTRLVLDLSAKAPFKALPATPGTRHDIALEGLQVQDVFLKEQKGRGLIRSFVFDQGVAGKLRLRIITKKITRIRKIFLMTGNSAVPHRLVIDIEPVKKAEGEGLAHKPPAGHTPNAAIKPKTAFIPIPGHKPLKHTVVIDAGHGGEDPGTLGLNKLFEKQITLMMAQEIKRQIDGQGRYRAVLTRERDEFMRLRQRFARAREVKADLFISLHADSHPNKNVRGLSVYTLSDQASDKEAALLASKENKADVIAGLDFKDESPDVANILIDLSQRHTMDLSVNFAQDVLNCIAKEQKLSENTHRFADFAVLKAPDVPSVLIELGYLSNPIDAERLSQKKYQKSFASDIVRAIDRYFQRLKR